MTALDLFCILLVAVPMLLSTGYGFLVGPHHKRVHLMDTAATEREQEYELERQYQQARHDKRRQHRLEHTDWAADWQAAIGPPEPITRTTVRTLRTYTDADGDTHKIRALIDEHQPPCTCLTCYQRNTQ